MTLTGNPPVKTDQLSAAGSNREYFRLYGSKTVIGVYGNSPEENNAFIYLSSFFRKAGLPVPEVYIYSPGKTCYLQEDLGDTLLFEAIRSGRESGHFTPQEKEVLRKAMELLPAIQFADTAGELDYTQCYPLPSFNKRSIFWDLNYFKYCFLKATDIEFSEDKLEDDFENLSGYLLKDTTDTFMYRDFQSRNIMLKENHLFLIDFQGGRKGPIQYDVASFVWQAKGNYPEDLREELVKCYLNKVQHYLPVNETKFKEQLRHFVLFRMLQVLGAYGFRGFFERKPHFIQSIPFALDNLRTLLETDFPGYPYLCSLVRQLTDKKNSGKE